MHRIRQSVDSVKIQPAGRARHSPDYAKHLCPVIACQRIGMRRHAEALASTCDFPETGHSSPFMKGLSVCERWIRAALESMRSMRVIGRMQRLLRLYGHAAPRLPVDS